MHLRHHSVWGLQLHLLKGGCCLDCGAAVTPVLTYFCWSIASSSRLQPPCCSIPWRTVCARHYGQLWLWFSTLAGAMDFRAASSTRAGVPLSSSLQAQHHLPRRHVLRARWVQVETSEAARAYHTAAAAMVQHLHEWATLSDSSTACRSTMPPYKHTSAEIIRVQ